MLRSPAQASLADLAAAGIRLRPYEAVTLVRELVLQVARGQVPGVPSAHVIRLGSSGALTVEGPVDAGGRSVVRAAQLLDALLPTFDAGAEYRVPGGLKLLIARGLGAIDLPPFGSLEEFADALGRFAATDPAATIAHLVATWADTAAKAPAAVPAEQAAPPAVAHVEPFVAPRPSGPEVDSPAGQLTVSDIRRARRATGMPLAEVAARTRVPVSLLRQLEWGYLLNWPVGYYGHAQLVRYARATGLDEELVLAAVTPLIEQAARHRSRLADRPVAPPAASAGAAASPGTAMVERESFDQLPVLAAGQALARTGTDDLRGPRRRTRVLAALAIPALLAVGLLPAWWARSTQTVDPAAPAAILSRSSDRGPLADERSPEAPAATNRNGAAPAAASVGEREPDASRAADAGRADEAPASADASEPLARPAAYTLASDHESYSPSYASAGTAMFYHEDADGRAALMRADTDSRGAVLRITRIVDDEAKNFHVRPSPDGTRIAFDSDRDGIRGVYVADADGRNVRRVSPPGFAAVPSWSPDSGRLAFVRAEDGRPRVWNLWTLDLASGEVQRITDFKYGQPWGGSWFPDGRRIAFSHEDRLYIRDLQSGEQRFFRTPKKGRLLRTPAVSPDGRRVIFQVHRDGAWLLELPQGTMRRVLEDPTAEEYTWSPDGRRVAYHSRRSGAYGVWVMAPR